MTIWENVDTLFALAVTAERQAGNYYGFLVKHFAGHTEVAAFWQKMQQEEESHQKLLESLQASLTYEQAQTPADPPVLEKARRVMDFWTQAKLRYVKNLDEAYELVKELEFFEINIVFTYLVETFLPSEERKQAILNALKKHQNHLTDFDKNFGDARWRQSIPMIQHP